MYDIVESSRTYNGSPYSGPAGDNKPQRYSSLVRASLERQRLLDRNPVGWDIYDIETQQIVEPLDIENAKKAAKARRPDMYPDDSLTLNTLLNVLDILEEPEITINDLELLSEEEIKILMEVSGFEPQDSSDET